MNRETDHLLGQLLGNGEVIVIAATLFVNLPDIRLILPGGFVRPGETAMIGELSHRAFEIFHPDKLFLGVGGIDARAGLTEYNWDDAKVKQAMLRSAKQTIVVADANKFDHIATVEVASLDVVDLLVTDQAPPPTLATALEQARVQVIIAA